MYLEHSWFPIDCSHLLPERLSWNMNVELHFVGFLFSSLWAFTEELLGVFFNTFVLRAVVQAAISRRICGLDIIKYHYCRVILSLCWLFFELSSFFKNWWSPLQLFARTQTIEHAPTERIDLTVDWEIWAFLLDCTERTELNFTIPEAVPLGIKCTRWNKIIWLVHFKNFNKIFLIVASFRWCAIASNFFILIS